MRPAYRIKNSNSGYLIMRRTSITERMILYYLLLSISTLTIIGAIFYYLAEDALMKRTFDQLTSVRVVKKRQIESFFIDRINDLNHLTILPEVKARIKSLNNRNISNGSYHLNSKVLESFINQNQYFYGLFLESIDRKSLLLTKDNLDSAYAHSFSYQGVSETMRVEIGSGKRIFENPSFFKQNERTPYLYLVSKVLERDSIIGYCSLMLSFDGINRIMLENNPENGLGNTGESYFVGADYLMRSNSRFLEESIYRISVNTKGADHALQGKEGTSIFVDYNGNPVLSSYDKVEIPGLNWVILAEIDLAEAEIPIIEFRNYIIFIISMISILTFIITFLISKRITNPIIILTDAATAIGEGRYDKIINIKTNDEIQKLSETFNTMSDQLKSKEDELENEKTKRISGVMDALESERERLSRELHDGLGQSLIALKLQLENVEPDEPRTTNLIIDEVKSRIDLIIHEIRIMSNDLMPSVLKEFGLTTAIRNMCHEISSLLNIDFIISIDIGSLKLSPRLSIYIFRIIQEGLNNIIKHAHSTNVDISVAEQNGILGISIKDDGIGFDTNGDYASKGNGLYYMKERVNLLNGDIKIDSYLNEGTSINISIKVNQNG